MAFVKNYRKDSKSLVVGTSREGSRKSCSRVLAGTKGLEDVSAPSPIVFIVSTMWDVKSRKDGSLLKLRLSCNRLAFDSVVTPVPLL